MAINIKFDLNGNPEPPTIILAERNGNKLGQLKVNIDSIDLVDRMNDVSEISFTINKYVDNKVTHLWDKIVNFKLIHCKEWDTWFEITVELDEETETVKTVLCKQLGQAELSQIKLYNVEINTEKDIARDDYKISILYDRYNPECSILNRVLEKAPHYSIAHVDSTIANIQRSFSFNDKSITDAFQEIAEEIGCLFIYNSNSDENGKLQRTISVYDLQQNCLNINCGFRGEYTDVCPKCGSTNIMYGYGRDTTIFVTNDELASSEIEFSTDTDSVKNCFKLEAGDDLMTATVRNCNPNGTDYIWYFSNDTKENMSDELVDKIESYDELYKEYYNNYESNIDANIVNKYNKLVTKYSVYDKDLQNVIIPIKGYPALMNTYYNVIDLSMYLKSSLMPTVEMSKTSAEEQAALLTALTVYPVAVANIKSVSLATANSAVLAMAKTIVRSTYKVEIKSSELTNNGDGEEIWSGNFIVTNYSDDEDTATSEYISTVVNGDEESFIKQKIDKSLNKENTDDYSITGLFKKDYNDFCAELKKYALNPLISFRDAGQACIDILIEQGIGNKDLNESWSNTEQGSDSNLYEKLYVPYYDKLIAIESEIKIREDEISLIDGVYDIYNNLVTEGLSTLIEKCRNTIQDALNFEEYLGENLWMEFCSFRREDKYSNSNYISDGLNNAELFDRALEFIEVAESEIYKSSELQHSISTTLKNLLAIPKFKPLVESFEIGNWIRVRVDDDIYKLRLLEYTISFGDFDNIGVEFSDVTKIKNGISDLESILSQASSMATSYDSIQKQAKQGNEARGTIDQWLTYGLNSALVRIQSNDSEEVTLTKNGLLARSYNEITDSYSSEQLKITHNIMAYTTDDWKTVKLAIGKHDYVTYSSSADKWVSDTGYGMSADFVTAGQVMGSKIVGGEIYSSNYHKGTVGDTADIAKGTYINLSTGSFSLGGGKIIYSSDLNTLSLSGTTIDWNTTNAPAELADVIQSTASAIDLASAAKKAAQDAADAAAVAQKAADDAQDDADTAQKAAIDAETNANKYTDSSTAAAKKQIEEDLTDAYTKYTDSKVSELDTAVGNYLGVGGSTLIGTNYLISPYIAGGYLNITNALNQSRVIIDPNNLTNTGYIFQVHNGDTITMGVDKNGSATFSGTITGSSFVGGSIYSTNYNKNVQGTYIGLNDGYFEVGGGTLTYSDNVLSLGKQDESSIINLCGGLGQIKFATIDEGKNVRGLHISAPVSNLGNIEISTNDSNGEVSLFAGDKFKSKIYGWSSSVRVDASSNITLMSRHWNDANSYNDYSSIGINYEGISLSANSNIYFLADNIVIEPELKICSYVNSSNERYELLRMTTTDGTEDTMTCVIGEEMNSTHIKSSSDVRLQNKNNSVIFKAYDNDSTAYDSFFEPSNDGKITLGTSNHKWYVLYASNATIQTSDRREKENIIPLDTSELFDRLKPVQYNYINGNDKICYGLIAQDVIETMNELGIDENKIDLVHHDFFPDEETGTEKDTYGIAYTNLIAMLIHEVQKLKTKNNELERKFSILEGN